MSWKILHFIMDLGHRIYKRSNSNSNYLLTTLRGTMLCIDNICSYHKSAFFFLPVFCFLNYSYISSITFSEYYKLSIEFLWTPNNYTDLGALRTESKRIRSTW